MSDIKIRVNGLPELLSRISGLSQEIQEEVSAEIIDSVMRINGRQRRLAPKDQGGLVRGIGYERKQTTNVAYFDLFSNSEQSGYMEFGTRKKVDHGYISKYGLDAIAQQMRGPGISTRLKAKQAIYAWCKRKGIEKKSWYAIFVTIMTLGVNPHPFFFEPFFEEVPKLMQRLKAIADQYSSAPTRISVIKPGDFIRNNPTITI